MSNHPLVSSNLDFLTRWQRRADVSVDMQTCVSILERKKEGVFVGTLERSIGISGTTQNFHSVCLNEDR